MRDEDPCLEGLIPVHRGTGWTAFRVEREGRHALASRPPIRTLRSARRVHTSSHRRSSHPQRPQPSHRPSISNLPSITRPLHSALASRGPRAAREAHDRLPTSARYPSAPSYPHRLTQTILVTHPSCSEEAESRDECQNQTPPAGQSSIRAAPGPREWRTEPVQLGRCLCRASEGPTWCWARAQLEEGLICL